ncbi:hypothetical protein ACA910_002270 [Epithemia clementina (nom. ined.)]
MKPPASVSPLVRRLGLDKSGRPRAIFLYDGECGVCKFSVGFVLERDRTDHFRFSPLQTAYAQDSCQMYGMPADLSTGILIEEETLKAHRDSSSILRMLPYLGFPYNILGLVALYLVPKIIRDFCYRAFARNRGAIWTKVKRVTGLGDTMMDPYRNQVLGIDDFEKIAIEKPGWGFTTATTTTTTTTKTQDEKNENSNENKKKR